MWKSNYDRFKPDDLTLRDELAVDRTLLANERTFLAYLRTGMALMIAGATMIHFANQGWFLAVGIACLPAGLVCGATGLIRFLSIHRSIGQALRKQQG